MINIWGWMKRMMKIKAIGHLIGQTITHINMYVYEPVTFEVLKNMWPCKILNRNVSNIFFLLKIIAPEPLFYIFGFNILFLAQILWQFFDTEHYTLKFPLKTEWNVSWQALVAMHWIIKKLLNLFCFILCICRDLENYV
jgi:hypothetical protein